MSADVMDGSARQERRGRRVRRVIVVVVLLLAAGAAVAVRARSTASATAAAGPPPPVTAALAVKTITNDATYDGVVLHATAMPVLARTAGHVTALVPEGITVNAGDTLFAVDAAPTVVMVGTVPAYRDLSFAAASGPDVKQLQDNLVALGFDPDHRIQADGTFSDATLDAVLRWQQQLGLAPTGVVALGTVLFEPGPIVMGTHQVEVGASIAAGAAVADAQLRGIEMQFTLPADARSLIAIGQSVDVTMPDRSPAKATIASIGTATDSSTGSTITVGRGAIQVSPPRGGAAGAAPSTTTVAVADLANIKVRVSQTIAANVLVAPAAAMTSHVDGTFTVTVVATDGSMHAVTVTPGVSANGSVAITGDGLAAGTKVLMPANV